MSNTKHTPGPWKHDTDFHLYQMNFYNAIMAADGYPPNGFHLTGVMSDANAKLIAAAPDLLEALESALPYLHKETRIKAEEAIKKATE